MSDDEPDYPEHEKVKEQEDDKRAAERFLRWLLEDTDLVLAIRGWKLSKVREEHRDPIEGPPERIYDMVQPDGPFNPSERLVPTPAKPDEIIARYLGIDHEAYLEEKEQMFEELRAMQQEGNA